MNRRLPCTSRYAALILLIGAVVTGIVSGCGSAPNDPEHYSLTFTNRLPYPVTVHFREVGVYPRAPRSGQCDLQINDTQWITGDTYSDLECRNRDLKFTFTFNRAGKTIYTYAAIPSEMKAGSDPNELYVAIGKSGAYSGEKAVIHDVSDVQDFDGNLSPWAATVVAGLLIYLFYQALHGGVRATDLQRSPISVHFWITPLGQILRCLALLVLTLLLAADIIGAYDVLYDLAPSALARITYAVGLVAFWHYLNAKWRQLHIDCLTRPRREVA